MSSTITMLGTGNAMCTRCYNTCFFLRTPSGKVLVDAGGGNGIFRQLYRAHISINDIHNLIITHVHTDHILGVIWLIRKISPLIYKGKYSGPLNIYCHDQAAHTLRVMCDLMLPSKISRAIDNTIIVRVVSNGETVRIDDTEYTFFDIASTKAKQYGFRAVLPGGTIVTCLGDEPYQQCSETYARESDWLLCEAFCLYRDRQQFNPYEKHHSTALDAGRLAQELNVKNLLLYHTEDRYLATRRPSYTAEAAQHFTGIIHVPDDLETVTLES